VIRKQLGALKWKQLNIGHKKAQKQLEGLTYYMNELEKNLFTARLGRDVQLLLKYCEQKKLRYLGKIYEVFSYNNIE
jgi:hypothetical protein